MDLVNREQFAATLGLQRCGDEPCCLNDLRGMAGLVRMTVQRRGAATRRDLHHDWLPAFEALGEDRERAKERLDEVATWLAELTDTTAVRISGQNGWAKAPPRWIRLGERQAVFLGNTATEFTSRLTSGEVAASRLDIARRFDPSVPDADGLLDDLNAEPLSFQDWLGHPGWIRHWERRHGRADWQLSLPEFWEDLRSDLHKSEMTALEGSAIRVLAAPPGGFFGRLHTPHPEGRWRPPEETPDGSWPAAKSGFGERHWQPLLVESQSGRISRVLLLEGWDEFNWAVVGRGMANDDEERMTVTETEVRFTFPIPDQVRRVLRLCGWPSGDWGQWQIAPGTYRCHADYWRQWQPFT
jgi:hypothetical protein